MALSKAAYSDLFRYSREGDFGGVRSEIHSKGEELSFRNLFTAVTFATAGEHTTVANYILDTTRERLPELIDSSTLDDASSCLLDICSYYTHGDIRDCSVVSNLLSLFGLHLINFTLDLAQEVMKNADRELRSFYDYYGGMSLNEWSEDPSQYCDALKGAEKTIRYLLDVKEEMTKGD